MPKNALIPLLLFVANIPLFVFLAKRLFGKHDSFWNNFKWHFIPDWISLLRGHWMKDARGEHKSGLFYLLCFVIYAIELIVIVNVFDL